MKLIFGLVLIYLAYAVVMVFLHPRFIYPFSPDGGVLPGFREVALTGADGVPVYVQLHEGTGPVVVYFMGNAGALPLFESAFQRHIEAGRQVVAMEYRGGGGRPGAPREDVLKRDALVVMEYAASFEKPLIVQGYSMGSGLATYVSTKQDVAGVILVAPFDAMCRLMARRAFLPACALPFVDHWRSLDQARDIAAPILVLHGSADQVIPPEHSAAFETLPTVQREIIKGAAHADIGQFSAYDDAMETFISGLPKN